jgi:Domain of unknown function (DUF5076)
MSMRVKEEASILKDHLGRTIIYRPIIIVEKLKTDDGHVIFLHPREIDPACNDPTMFGILLSDLLYHIAAAYHRLTGRDERDVRSQLLKTLRDEDRFKDKDPSRGDMVGAVFGGDH